MKRFVGALIVIALFLGVGVGALLLASTPASAATSTCWQVDCNTCCRIGGGKVICTQRACV